jgi:putative peptidoglycan lipid II flippase
VTYALQFYAVGLTGHAAVEIGVRVFYALHDTWTPVRVGVAAMALNVGLSLLWVNWLGHGGLALANSVATTVEMAALYWLLHRRMGGLALAALGGTLARSALAAGAMAGAVWAWLAWAEGTADVWVTALGGLALAVAVYGAVALALGSTELRPLWAVVQRRAHIQR